jgi:hypothetical protein
MNHYIIYGSFIHGCHLELTEDPLSGEVTLEDFTYNPRNWDLHIDEPNEFYFSSAVDILKNTEFEETSELKNVAAYRPTSETLHIYDESSSSDFNNIIVEEYKLSAFKWYRPTTDPLTRVLHFNDDYFSALIANNKLPTVFGQTILRNKLSYRLQQRIRNRPFNDISDGALTLLDPAPKALLAIVCLALILTAVTVQY